VIIFYILRYIVTALFCSHISEFKTVATSSLQWSRSESLRNQQVRAALHWRCR